MSARASRRGPSPQNTPTAVPTAPPRRSRISVLGLDPASRHCGVVALDQHGALRDWACWEPLGSIGDRLSWIEQALTLAIRELRPEVVAWEYGRGPNPAPELDALLRGLPAWCRAAGVPVERQRVYRPQTWRAEMVEAARAPKTQVLELLRRYYPVELRPIPLTEPDATEAWAIARCFWEKECAGSLLRLLAAENAADRGAPDLQVSPVRTTSYRQKES